MTLLGLYARTCADRLLILCVPLCDFFLFLLCALCMIYIIIIIIIIITITTRHKQLCIQHAYQWQQKKHTQSNLLENWQPDNSGGSRHFEKGGVGTEDNVSAPSPFIANVHNELHAFYTGKGEFFFAEKIAKAAPFASAIRNSSWSFSFCSAASGNVIQRTGGNAW